MENAVINENPSCLTTALSGTFKIKKIAPKKEKAIKQRVNSRMSTVDGLSKTSTGSIRAAIDPTRPKTTLTEVHFV